jgi:hypothetical protein
MSVEEIGSYGVFVKFCERMWCDVYVGRCVAGDQPDDAIDRANDAVAAYRARSRRRDDLIMAGKDSEVYA